MRAAIITSTDVPPGVGEFRDPVAGKNGVVVDVRVAGLNPVDLYRARGDLGEIALPSVAGSEGIAELDYRRVYFDAAIAPYGSIAERALIDPDAVFEVPDGVSDELAVSLGIAGLAGWLPLSHHARLEGGERVLILGATGVAGQIAVQAAKLLGAGSVVAAGRDRDALKSLCDRGADAVVVLDDDSAAAVEAVAGEGFDVVIDYVFGAPFEAALPNTAMHASVVIVGGGAGQSAALAFRALQGRRVIGHANWAVPRDVRRAAFAAMAEHALSGSLVLETTTFDLENIEEAWRLQGSSPHSKLVIALP